MKKDDYEYVYMIYDQRNPNDILYVGKTNSIESRYCDHFHGSKSKRKLWILFIMPEEYRWRKYRMRKESNH